MHTQDTLLPTAPLLGAGAGQSEGLAQLRGGPSMPTRCSYCRIDSKRVARAGHSSSSSPTVAGSSVASAMYCKEPRVLLRWLTKECTSLMPCTLIHTSDIA